MIDYPLYCVIPAARILRLQPDYTFHASESFSNVEYEVGHHTDESQYHSIEVWLQDGSRKKMTATELGEYFKFTFISRLWFLHEKELRSVVANPIGETPLDLHLDEEACRAVLSEGRFHKDTSIRFVNNVVNYGLYADKLIPKGVMIGEYVGIVHAAASSPNPYSLLYPTHEGKHQIDGREYGNATRFINHASDPNCKYEHVMIDNLNHTVCVTKRDIRANEQITVNYGATYWIQMNEVYNIEALPVVDNNEYADDWNDFMNEGLPDDLMCCSVAGLCPIFCMSGLCAISHGCCCDS